MDHFETLGLKPGQRSRDDVKAAFRRLIMKFHPDKCGKAGEEVSKRLNVAYHAIMEGELYDPESPGALPDNKRKRTDESERPHKARKTSQEDNAAKQSSADQRGSSEEVSDEQMWNEATRRMDNESELQFTRTSLTSTRRDLLKKWRGTPEQRELLNKYDQRLNIIDERIADIEAERQAVEKKARQKWEEDMLKWNAWYELEAVREEETREQSVDDNF